MVLVMPHGHRRNPDKWHHNCVMRAVIQVLSGDLHQLPALAKELADYGDGVTAEEFQRKLEEVFRKKE